ncbi:serine hydrolase domain-containing protein [Streptomyces zagrosensis]|uniref:CubicO group peptidase (Beta-lactamase class C family) n=1 Tax=Streptomyces zagrosensis TaxID=1042984 RepID=A0A7W9Q5T5_9ACTN|nr:serine hydrolase domain-containing protein [Streptomyces zagrosensis]MBB5934151.1 CubicO group peptidase (beta-lactamase class C family) [Streptomyces zagrosensis]
MTETAPPDAPRDELFPATRRALLHRIAVGQADGRAPSLMGAVVREGQLVWSGARSMMDGHAPEADTQYRIGSITKSFVAVLVLRLRDEGLLDLADPLRTHLADRLDVEGVDVSMGDATVAQLLAHTSGIAAEARGPWWERTPGELRPGLGEVFGERPQRLPAGRRFHYSNPGYALLGALVEQKRGAPWGEVLRREILEPLGMPRTSIVPQAPHAGGWAVHPWADVMQQEPTEDMGHMGPAGQLWSTTADLARFAVFLTNGDDRVLSATTVAEMRRPATPPDGAAWEAAYGLGLQLLRRDGRLFFGHTGSMPGFVSTLWISAEEQLAGIVLANATSGPATSLIAADLVRIVAEHEPPLPTPWRPLPQADADLLDLTGVWYWGTSTIGLRLRADRWLELGPLQGGGRGSRFRPEADGTWTGLDGYYAGETLRVVRTESSAQGSAGDGSPGILGTVTHLDVGTFVFTRRPYDPADSVPGTLDPEGWRGF